MHTRIYHLKKQCLKWYVCIKKTNARKIYIIPVFLYRHDCNVYTNILTLFPTITLCSIRYINRTKTTQNCWQRKKDFLVSANFLRSQKTKQEKSRKVQQQKHNLPLQFLSYSLSFRTLSEVLILNLSTRIIRNYLRSREELKPGNQQRDSLKELTDSPTLIQLSKIIHIHGARGAESNRYFLQILFPNKSLVSCSTFRSFESLSSGTRIRN